MLRTPHRLPAGTLRSRVPANGSGLDCAPAVSPLQLAAEQKGAPTHPRPRRPASPPTHLPARPPAAAACCSWQGTSRGC
jgi:hypothetical protein